MPTVPIRTHALSKRYGDHVALRDLDLEVQPGEVFGFLGPNGSGKTTTIRLLLDLIRPSGGTVEVLGLDPRRDGPAVRRRVGYLPGELAFDERLTGHNVIAYFSNLRGGSRAVDPRYVAGLAGRFDLDLSRPIGDLSKGNKQKVGIVQAVMHRPELLILDEPTGGLDPLMQQVFREIVTEAKAEGRTAFLSSHILSEVEHVADRVAILRAGTIVRTGRLDEIRAAAVRRVELRFAAPVPAEAFAGLPGVQEASFSADGRIGLFAVAGSADALVKAAARFEVERIEGHEPDLESLFLGYYGVQDAEAPERRAPKEASHAA